MPRLTPLDKAIRAAGKRLPFSSRKQQQDLLEYAADDLADAYRTGAEEAQIEILKRLYALQKSEASAKS